MEKRLIRICRKEEAVKTGPALVSVPDTQTQFLSPTRKAMKFRSSTMGTPSNSVPMRTVFCEELKHPTSDRLGREDPFVSRKGHKMDDITHVAPAATLWKLITV